MQPILSLAEES